MRSLFNPPPIAPGVKPTVPSGAAMLLKSMLGIDPVEFMTAIEAMVTGVRETKAQLDRIEGMLNVYFSQQAQSTNSAVSSGDAIPIRSAGLHGGDVGGYGVAPANGGIDLSGDIPILNRT